MPQSEEEKKQRRRESTKRYREKNKEKIKEYRQAPQVKKLKRINLWKRRGIVPPCSWDEFHDEWEKAINCADCDLVMTIDRYITSTTKCADHDHSITDGSPNFRGFVCNGCNIRRG